MWQVSSQSATIWSVRNPQKDFGECINCGIMISSSNMSRAVTLGESIKVGGQKRGVVDELAASKSERPLTPPNHHAPIIERKSHPISKPHFSTTFLSLLCEERHLIYKINLNRSNCTCKLISSRVSFLFPKSEVVLASAP